MKLRRENIFTLLNAHLLLALVLAITCIVLLTRLVLAWNTLRTDSSEQIQQYRINMRTIELQTAPLRGLPAKVDTSAKQAADFYDKRFPSNYSSITAELYNLEEKEHIHVASLHYINVPALPGLEEVRVDASVAGEYSPMMHYINGLERDKLFFLITGLTLSGQQGGNVNVRLKLITYIHADDAEHMAPPADVGPPEKTPAPATADAPTSGGQ